MTRAKLPTRRPSMNKTVPFLADGEKIVHLLITIGFNEKTDLPMEVFCASFKAGTTMNTTVMDACLLLSRCLQHGDTPAELVASMSDQPSMLGAIASALVDL